MVEEVGPAARAHDALKRGLVPDEHRPIVRTWLTRRARLMEELQAIDDQLAEEVVSRWWKPAEA